MTGASGTYSPCGLSLWHRGGQDDDAVAEGEVQAGRGTRARRRPLREAGQGTVCCTLSWSVRVCAGVLLARFLSSSRAANAPPCALDALKQAQYRTKPALLSATIGTTCPSWPTSVLLLSCGDVVPFLPLTPLPHATRPPATSPDRTKSTTRSSSFCGSTSAAQLPCLFFPTPAFLTTASNFPRCPPPTPPPPPSPRCQQLARGWYSAFREEMSARNHTREQLAVLVEKLCEVRCAIKAKEERVLRGPCPRPPRQPRTVATFVTPPPSLLLPPLRFRWPSDDRPLSRSAAGT